MPAASLCRQLWLYCGVYDFAGLQAQQANGGGRWPASWRAALGRVAGVTPLLIVGWEQYKPDEMLESLASEFGSRLTKLGPLGEPAALMQTLAAVLGSTGPPLPAPLVGASSPGPQAAALLRGRLPAYNSSGKQQHPAHRASPASPCHNRSSQCLQAAHLLTQATKSLCRACFSSYEACAQEGAIPVNAPMRHLQLSVPGALGYSWQLMVAEKARRGPAVASSCQQLPAAASQWRSSDIVSAICHFD